MDNRGQVLANVLYHQMQAGIFCGEFQREELRANEKASPFCPNRRNRSSAKQNFWVMRKYRFKSREASLMLLMEFTSPLCPIREKGCARG